MKVLNQDFIIKNKDNLSAIEVYDNIIKQLEQEIADKQGMLSTLLTVEARNAFIEHYSPTTREFTVEEYPWEEVI